MYYIVGLGKTGISFLKRFPDSYVWDDTPDPGYAGPLTPPHEILWHTITALILSPGISHLYPKAHKAASLARHYRVPIWCDVEVFLQHYPSLHPIGITGTNGKSTTTALLHHVLHACGTPALMGGNIGMPLFELEPFISPIDHAVCIIELSSYQLERTPSWGNNPSSIGVITNITPDHLSRHGGIKGYINAKKHILQAPLVFIGIDTPDTLALYQSFKDHHPCLIPVSVETPINQGIYLENGMLIDQGEKVFNIDQVTRLPGLHNAQNMALCYGVAKTMGLNPEMILNAMISFPGLPHRLEWVGRKGHIQFVNDSKATNPEAVAHALKAYNDIYWILGGQPKESLLQGLERYYPHIRKAYVFGQGATEFYKILAPHIPTQRFTTLDEIIPVAYKDAVQAGKGVLLLSPACASWDQYTNFEARGDHFKALIYPFLETTP